MPMIKPQYGYDFEIKLEVDDDNEISFDVALTSNTREELQYVIFNVDENGGEALSGQQVEVLSALWAETYFASLDAHIDDVAREILKRDEQDGAEERQDWRAWN